MGTRVGLDIGIASVGWCVLDDEAQEIKGIGVRTFPKAENPKDGASLALPRRLARSVRRRLKRRRERMQEFRRFLVEGDILTEDDLESAFVPLAGSKSPYQLRAEALDRRLDCTEWARVLSQLCKRRGYLSTKFADDEADKEKGLVKEAIAQNAALMEEKGYRTIGEMLWLDERFAESKRNKGDYKGVVPRELVVAEVGELFAAQRRHKSRLASKALEKRYISILSTQARVSEGEAIRDLVGVCSLDRKNPRIPIACPTFEHFRLLDKLLHVRYTLDGERHLLTQTQRQAVIGKAYAQKTALTMTHVRKLAALPDDARFVGIRYDRQAPQDVSAESKEKLPGLPATKKMRQSVEAVSKDEWARLSSDSDLLDEIATVLTYYKFDDSVRHELASLGLDPKVVAALADLRFSKNGHLSRETLLAIIPHMEVGLQYSDACAAAGFHHSATVAGNPQPKLPPIPSEDVRNPVVLRALSQSRKILNAIIDTFGPIDELHVELGRDVAKSARERGEIEREQKKYAAANDAVAEDLRVHHGLKNPRPLDYVKYKLWKEQGGKCVYSGQHIDAARMLSGEPGVAEVDHALPHSRSFDNGYMNKVLCTATENQRKRGKTPFEYLGGDAKRWHEFEERVKSMHLPRPKRERLLRREFDERDSEDFRERNLVDTQYAARFFKNFVEANLQFAGDQKRPVLTVNGRATAYLRTGWQLQKVRSEGDLHHALDAAVIAAADRSMVQKVSNFYSARPIRKAKGGTYVDRDTGEIVDPKHVPEPWDGFARQVEAALSVRFGDHPLADLASPAPRPILVSRMPNRSVRGEAHKETVRRIEGETDSGHVTTSKRVRLEDLTPRLVDKMVGRERDAELYGLLKNRLEAHGGDGAKAFAEPIFKPTRPGRVAPRVRAIRVYEDPSSGGTRVRGGLADNGKMVRTDVFEKDGKYYLVPVYMKDVAAGVLPNRAIASGKPEHEWRLMDDSYRFAFSLYLNDLVCLVKKKGEGVEGILGYFKGTNRNNGSITIEAHDCSWARGSLGVAQNIVSFDKYQVDVLGLAVHPVRQEKRVGFSHRGHRQTG